VRGRFAAAHEADKFYSSPMVFQDRRRAVLLRGGVCDDYAGCDGLACGCSAGSDKDGYAGKSGCTIEEMSDYFAIARTPVG
jgi:hypothetical protein